MTAHEQARWPDGWDKASRPWVSPLEVADASPGLHAMIGELLTGAAISPYELAERYAPPGDDPDQLARALTQARRCSEGL